MNDEEIKKVAKQTANEIGEQICKGIVVLFIVSVILRSLIDWLTH